MTKEQERNELHRTIWQIANDLRGSVDGWDFKAYVLGMLFYRFISENLTAYLNLAEHEAGNAEFDYAGISDEMAEFGRAETVREKGFYILPSELFVNVRARAKEDPNLNETLSVAGGDWAADGKLDFVGHTREYAHRAHRVKELFERHGFHIVYDKDQDEHVSDGFFFTVGYGSMPSSDLVAALLRYGICAISLTSTGSLQNGVRVCVSQMNREEQYDLLDRRLRDFAQDYARK